jgi:hypothetical protein
MTETQRVPAPRLPLSGHGTFTALVAIGILSALILKPWGAPEPGTDGVALPRASTPGPTPRPTPILAGFAYDQSVFGPFEPSPEWSVWPGGFFVTLLYVTREARDVPSAAPTPVGGPSPSPGLGASDGWPASITIGPGDHLLWLGLNTPARISVRETTVWHLHEDGIRSAMPVVRLPTEWGPNFAVIGIPVTTGSSRLSVWPQGRYEVAVRLDPSGEMRTMLVDIQTLTDPASASPDAHPH